MSYKPAIAKYGASEGTGLDELAKLCKDKSKFVQSDIWIIPPRIGTRVNTSPATIERVADVSHIHGDKELSQNILDRLCLSSIRSGKAPPPDVRVKLDFTETKGAHTVIYAEYPYANNPQDPINMSIGGQNVIINNDKLKFIIDHIEKASSH